MQIEFFLVIMVVVAAIIDFRSRRIPNLLVLSGLTAALGAQLALPSGMGFKAWGLGMLTGFGLFLPLYLLRGMAAGDVKLMAAVGSFVGPLAAMKIALIACVFGGLMAIGVILYKKRVKDACANLHTLMIPIMLRFAGLRVDRMDIPPEQSVGKIPYGVAIALGSLAHVALTFSGARFF